MCVHSLMEPIEWVYVVMSLNVRLFLVDAFSSCDVVLQRVQELVWWLGILI